ncbi:hypothetical protein BCR44DRAFT_1438922 [Catenaria anguillulae PL171]|uniref:Uncharacterized protein n=1 Tax=Catenaria anguillulae PL171 TaxID=765915 RepID=A0A1Y2HHM3_9FUNG|nr:hypothetical protein BCR44DRAFT_1438922 [Catenaria anguillulae PL171]
MHSQSCLAAHVGVRLRDFERPSQLTTRPLQERPKAFRALLVRIVATCAFTLALFTQTVNCVPYAPRYSWSITVRGQPVSSAALIHPVVAPGTNFSVILSISHTTSQSQCAGCARDLHAVGGYPTLSFTNSIIRPLQDMTDPVTVRKLFSPTTCTWIIPCQSSSTISSRGGRGLANLLIRPSTLLPSYLAVANFNVAQPLTIKVSALFSIDPATGLPTSKLGTLSAVPAPPSLPATPSQGLLGDDSGILGGSHVVFTTNAFWTSAKLTPQWSEAVNAAPLVCTGATGMVVNDLEELAGGRQIVFATTKGLVVYNATSNTMSIALSECIVQLAVSSGIDPVVGTCPLAIMSSSYRLWTIDPVTGVVARITSSSGQSLYEFLGTINYQIISSDISNMRCGDVAALYLRSGTYYVATLTSGVWSVRFKFPASVPICTATPQLFNDSSVVQYPTAFTVTTTGSRALTLTGLMYSKAPSNDLYIYGSALFYSPDNGNSQFLVENAPGSTMISTFATSATSYGYMYLFTDGTMFGGLAPFPATFPLGTAPPSTVSLDFDAVGQPYTLQWTSSGLVRTNIDWAAQWDAGVLSAAVSPATSGVQPTCSYGSIRVQGTMDPRFTRTALPVSRFGPLDSGVLAIGVDVRLPSAIYLDYSQSYSFTVDLAPVSASDPLSALMIAVQVSDPDLVQVTSDRIELVSQYRVVYRITVRDRGVYGKQRAPGVDLSPVTVTISVINGEPCPLSTVGPLVVYIGCAPGQMCVNPDPNPTFSLIDTVTGTATPFANPITLSVVGGGPRASGVAGISTFSASDLSTINEITWSPNFDTDLPRLSDGRYVYPTAQGVNISWVCLSGSPCSGIVPTFPDPPEYMFRVMATTANVSTGLSYCTLDTSYPTRLYGLALDLTTSLLATGLTLLITLLLVVASAAWQKHLQTKGLMQVNPILEFDAMGVARMPLEGASGIGGEFSLSKPPSRTGLGGPGSQQQLVGILKSSGGSTSQPGSRPGSGGSQRALLLPSGGGAQDSSAAATGRDGQQQLQQQQQPVPVQALLRNRPAILEEEDSAAI